MSFLGVGGHWQDSGMHQAEENEWNVGEYTWKRRSDVGEGGGEDEEGLKKGLEEGRRREIGSVGDSRCSILLNEGTQRG
ncbi:hypothetical protein BT69DRAFT_1277697 [Atractiella rhizophila]|nr:hypothetical protein BT69DRAFT_1277697 [Atractiella rhizophila]